MDGTNEHAESLPSEPTAPSFVGLLPCQHDGRLSFVNLGIFNLVFALLIAACKALLIILFFMEARRSSKVIWIVAGAGFFWLGILLVLSVGDYLTRGWVPGTGQ